jgi:oligoribonuclease
VDTETTGLDPWSDWLLEVGVVITDDDLVEIDAYSVLVKEAPTRVMSQGMSDYVREMHTANGLLADVELDGVDIDVAEWALMGKLGEWGIEPGTIPMSGSTVAFDRGFLKEDMPAFNALFHYRSIDVSTLKELCRQWRPDLLVESSDKDKKHRVLDDCRASIAELRRYREGLFTGLRADT